MKAIEILSRDPMMKELIEKYGELTLEKNNNYFGNLLSAIIGQQLSSKAADTIYKRMATLMGNNISPENVLKTPDENLRQAGISGNKIKYIKNLSQAVLDGSLDLDNIHEYDNEKVLQKLTTIKGIGLWTAEMFLIFSLAREDIFSFSDGGLNGAINKLYGGGSILSKEEIINITDKWKPYRSLASLYLWESIDNKNS